MGSSGATPSPPPSRLRRSVTSAFGATFVIFVAKRFLEICFLAALARTLSPGEFGVVAAATVLVSFAGQVAQLGIAPTLIQAAELGGRTIAVARTIVLGAAIVMLVLLQISAGWAANWFRDPEVGDVVRVLSIVCLAQAISLAPQALMTRQLRARELGLIEIVADIAGMGCVAIPLALAGWGYWALVYGAVAHAIAKMIVLLLRVRLGRFFAFDWKIAKELWFMGAGFSLTVLLHRIALESDRVIVGRYMNSFDLGLYSRASGLMIFPASFYGSLVDRIAFPAFAQIRGEKERLAKAYLHAISLTALLGLSLTVFLTFVGRDVILLVLGSSWSGAILPFQILCLGMYFRLSDRVSGTVLRGLGRPYILARVQILAGAAAIAGSLVGVRFGTSEVAFAMVAAASLSYLLLTITAIRAAGIRFREFLAAHAHGVAMAVLMAFVLTLLLWVARRTDLPPILTLCACGFACCAVGLVALWAAPKVFLGDAGRTLMAALPTFLPRRGSARI